MAYDPTKETFALEQRDEVDGVPVTVRVTVQADEVVAVTVVVDQGYGLPVARLKDLSLDKTARKAMKEQPDEVRKVGQEGDE